MILAPKAIRHKLRDLASLPVITASLVGSFRSTKKLGRIDDIDIHVVVQDPIDKSYGETLSFFKKLAGEITSEHILATIESRRGPFKPKYQQGKHVLQLHLLIDTPRTLGELALVNLVDWANQAMHLAGTRLHHYSVSQANKEKLLSSASKCLEEKRHALSQDEIHYREWRWQDGTLVLRADAVSPIDKFQQLELLRFSTFVGLADYAIALDPSLVTTTDKLLTIAKRILPHYVPFLLSIISMRRRYRSTGLLDFDNAEWRKLGLKFIDELLHLLYSLSVSRNFIRTGSHD